MNRSDKLDVDQLIGNSGAEMEAYFAKISLKVRFEELEADPLAQVERIAQQLDLNNFAIEERLIHHL